MRTHAKALILPAVALVLDGALLGVGTALVPTDYRPGGQYVVVVGVLALAVRTSLVPFLRWRHRTYTVTNHRLITRQGILTRTGHDLPLMRVNDVSYQRSLSDRLLGCGTLYVQTAAEGALVLDDVPEVGRVHQTMTELLFDSSPAQLASGPPDDDHDGRGWYPGTQQAWHPDEQGGDRTHEQGWDRGWDRPDDRGWGRTDDQGWGRTDDRGWRAPDERLRYPDGQGRSDDAGPVPALTRRQRRSKAHGRRR
jgi:membrane protein YdbS with pleckstrin-like domain